MTKFLKPLFFIVLIVTASGCRKPNSANQDPTIPRPELKSEEIGIYGTVQNEYGTVMSGATINVEGNSVQTDIAGNFYLTGKVSNTDKVVIQVSKAGYFTYKKTIVMEKNTLVGNLKFSLVADKIAGTFAAANGGTVRNDYVTLVFQANGVIKDDGSSYQGTVTVKMPVYPVQDTRRQFTGDGRGIATTGEKVLIDPWASFNVELYSESGEKLLLSKPMNFTFLMGFWKAYAPQTFKTWSFDEKENLWTEVGTASVDKGSIIGSTKSLSYIQWGNSFPRALLRAIVKDNKENVAPGFVVSNVIEANGGGDQTMTTNSNGVALIYVPAEKAGKIRITNTCNEGVANLTAQSILREQTSVQTFTLDLNRYLTTISGSYEDCSFAGLDGKAVLQLDNRTYTSPLKNGAYEFKLFSCGYSDGQLAIFNAQGQSVFTNNSVSVIRGSNNAQPVVSPCQLPQKGTITFVADGVTRTFKTPEDEITYKTTYLSGSVYTTIIAISKSRNENFSLSYRPDQAGVHPITSLISEKPGKNFLMTWGFYDAGSVTVSKYKQGNVIVEGSFNSTISVNAAPSPNDKVVNATGNFSVTY